jgi:hypothetical protein
MNRINLFRNTSFQESAICNTPAKHDFLAWGKTNFEKSGGVVVFAALLIICSIAVGCSSNSSKPATSNNSSPAAPSAPPQMLANSSVPAPAAPDKPAPKKVTRKRPATVTYVDKTYGVSFEYPRRYAIETGDAANDLLSSRALPMNFALTGGTVLAAVVLPETGFANTDFSSAFFDVSVNNRISEEDCERFAAPETPASTAVTPSVQASSEPPAPVQNASAAGTQRQAASDAPKADVKAEETASSSETNTSEAKTSETKTPEAKTATPAENSSPASTTPAVAPAPKVMLSDMEMRKTEAVSGEGNQQSDTKYFHVYQNGACYEFALNVTTVATQNDGEMKHVDRDKVFNRLRGILATVKINPIEAEKEAASAPVPAK